MKTRPIIEAQPGIVNPNFWGHERQLIVEGTVVQVGQCVSGEEWNVADRLEDRQIYAQRTRIQVEYKLPRPVWVCVGRVSTDTNIEHFLSLDLPGSKVVIGDGPDRHQLERDYPECHFLGYKFGEDLVAHLECADVFVFPRHTDSFGLAMLEAMACGLPVAALADREAAHRGRLGTAVLDRDLGIACLEALRLNGGGFARRPELSPAEGPTGKTLSGLAERLGAPDAIQ